MIKSLQSPHILYISHHSLNEHRLKAKSNLVHNELNSVDHLYTAKHTFKHILFNFASLYRKVNFFKL